jgi:hypothetical protein
MDFSAEDSVAAFVAVALSTRAVLDASGVRALVSRPYVALGAQRTLRHGIGAPARFV